MYIQFIHVYTSYVHTYICTVHIDVHICDWLWKNPPVTHKDKHLKICNSSIQSVIYQEDLELQPCNLTQLYSYLIVVRIYPLHNAQL